MTRLALLAFLAVGLLWPSAAAGQTLGDAEARWNAASLRVRSLELERAALAPRVQKIAKQLEKAKKAGSDISALQRSSQEVADELRGINTNLIRAKNDVKSASAAYAKLIEARIKELSPDDSPQSFSKILALEQRLALVRSRSSRSLNDINLVPVEADELDSPDDLRAKADLLRDQYDKVKKVEATLIGFLKQAQQRRSRLLRTKRTADFQRDARLFRPPNLGEGDEGSAGNDDECNSIAACIEAATTLDHIDELSARIEAELEEAREVLQGLKIAIERIEKEAERRDVDS